jgi:hypothetical protein
MSPKGPYGKGLVSSVALLEGCGNFKRWRLAGGLLVVRGLPQRGLWELNLFFLSSVLPGHDIHMLLP